MYVGFLLQREEVGILRVVGYEPVSGDGDDDSQQAFENEDPAPATVVPNTIHVRDTLQREPDKRLFIKIREGALTQARIPPNAPARDAALKNSATLY
jgi:hypothetical protein